MQIQQIQHGTTASISRIERGTVANANNFDGWMLNYWAQREREREEALFFCCRYSVQRAPKSHFVLQTIKHLFTGPRRKLHGELMALVFVYWMKPNEIYCILSLLVAPCSCLGITSNWFQFRSRRMDGPTDGRTQRENPTTTFPSAVRSFQCACVHINIDGGGSRLIAYWFSRGFSSHFLTSLKAFCCLPCQTLARH